jgi:Flp pilus assembly pilin Flp
MHARWTELKAIVRSTVRADDGQDLAEYAILVGLIALVVVGAVTLFGTQLTTMYDDIVSTLPFR